MNRLLRVALPLALLLGQCQKKEAAPARPEDLLPPATQTGANTFGCLLNGQPWTPRGSNGTDNYKVIYDASYIGGYLDIRAYRYPPGQTDNQYIGMGGLPSLNQAFIRWTARQLGCTTVPGLKALASNTIMRRVW